MTPTTGSRLVHKSLATRLLHARELLMQRFRPHLLKFGVTEQQYRLLRTLADQGAKSSLELSQRCVIQPTSLSRILAKLEEDGLIERSEEKQDRRKRRVRISERGRDLIARIAPGNDEIYNGMVAEVGDEIVGQTYAVLDRLIDALEKAESSHPLLLPPRRSQRERAQRRLLEDSDY
jgi:homoprotocatechuate degradation regulator HpaR